MGKLENEKTSLDVKQQVLMAIYTEYQKDTPEMYSNVSAETLQMDCKVFAFAVAKLLNEGLITDAKVTRGDGGYITAPIMDCTMMTASGIRYVEDKLGINPSDASEQKVKSLMGKASEWGIERLENIAAKWLAEMTKGQ